METVTVISPRRVGWWIATAFLILPSVHAIAMIIDWNLRDPATPRQGGLPEALLYGFQWTSLMIFLVAVYRMLPPGWHFLFRILLALVATGAAMVVMVFCWLSYVINFGIDSI